MKKGQKKFGQLTIQTARALYMWGCTPFEIGAVMSISFYTIESWRRIYSWSKDKRQQKANAYEEELKVVLLETYPQLKEYLSILGKVFKNDGSNERVEVQDDPHSQGADHRGDRRWESRPAPGPNNASVDEKGVLPAPGKGGPTSSHVMNEQKRERQKAKEQAAKRRGELRSETLDEYNERDKRVAKKRHHFGTDREHTPE